MTDVNTSYHPADNIVMSNHPFYEKQLKEFDVAKITKEIQNLKLTKSVTAPKVDVTPYLNKRKMRAIHIGMGASGIAAAILQQWYMPDVELQCYEKNPIHGGTWYENTYPGCENDVPSHLYSFTFEPNPDWNSAYSGWKEIWEYFDKVARKYDTLRFCKFNAAVTKCVWAEDEGKWHVTVYEKGVGEYVDTCDVLINGMGVLNQPKWPTDHPGWGTYKGHSMHTARWDHSYDLKGKNVAIIGTGASAVQTIPSIQPVVGHLTVFQRSPVWISVRKYSGNYTEEEKRMFREDPAYQEAMRAKMWWEFEERYKMLEKGSPEQIAMFKAMQERYEKMIPDPELRKILTPDYPFGCRRITPHDKYLTAVQAENCTVVTGDDFVGGFYEDGIITRAGKKMPFDCIIYATGFYANFVPPFDIIGRIGNMRDVWADIAQGYETIAVHGFPNYFTTLGPNGPLAHNSILPSVEKTIGYIVQAIRYMQDNNLKCVDPKKDVQERFNAFAQNYLKKMVWSGGCGGWYKDGQGRVTAMWPGSGLDYYNHMERPNWEHYEKTPMSF